MHVHDVYECISNMHIFTAKEGRPLPKDPPQLTKIMQKFTHSFSTVAYRRLHHLFSSSLRILP